jgi:DNA-binding LacI/PurR family transcriptional regulator
LIVKAKPTIGPAAMTMEDLAVLAGVSKITISRALRDSALVAPETRALIQRLAQQHGYKLNVSARNLRLQRSRMIEVVVEMRPAADRPMSDPYPLELLGGICQELTTAGYSVLLQAPPSGGLLPSHTADGIILLGQGPHGDAVRELAKAGLPMVVWGAEDPAGSTIVVGSDNRQGGEIAAKRLLALGRRNLVFLGDTDHAEVAARHAGFVETLASAGDTTVITIRPTGFTFSGGNEAIRALLRSAGGTFDGLFAASDLLAIGAISALTDVGLAIPDAVSVIGYDDTPMAASFVPPLTSIHQDWREGGALLAKKILLRIEGETVHSEMLPTRLVVRGS